MRHPVRLAFACLAWLGCGCGDEAQCSEPEPLRYLQSGTYASDGGAPTDWYCDVGCGTVFPPHAGTMDLEMDIALAAQTVTIRYTRDGKRIEERWRITGRESR